MISPLRCRHYRYALAQAEAHFDAAAVKELKALGGPPLDTFDHYLVLRLQLNRYLAPSDLEWSPKQYALLQAELSPGDLRAYYEALQNLTGMQSTVLAMDITEIGLRFKIPIFFIQGTQDHIVDEGIVTRYFEKIQAPVKRLSRIEGAGHFVPETHTERVLEAIREDARLVPSLRK